MSQGINGRMIIRALQANGLFCPYCGSEIKEYTYDEVKSEPGGDIRELRTIACGSCGEEIQVLEDDDNVSGDITYAAPPLTSRSKAIKQLKKKFPKSKFIKKLNESDLKLVFMPYMKFDGRVMAEWNILEMRMYEEDTERDSGNFPEWSVAGSDRKMLSERGPYISPFVRNRKTANLGMLENAKWIRISKNDLNLLENCEINSQDTDEYINNIVAPEIEYRIHSENPSTRRENYGILFSKEVEISYSYRLKNIDYDYADMSIVYFPIWYFSNGSQYVGFNAYTCGVDGKFDSGSALLDVAKSLKENKAARRGASTVKSIILELVTWAIIVAGIMSVGYSIWGFFK